LINGLFSLAVLIVGVLIVYQRIHWTLILLPLVWLPLIFFTLGWGYFLASLGVFIRDVSATVSLLTTILLFLTPIFYPVRAIPQQFRFVSQINPLAVYVEDSRRVVLWGILPDWPWFFCGVIFSVVVFVFGFAWFMKSKKAFADVI
jgi:lipopolysaccharide transport system permease protein